MVVVADTTPLIYLSRLGVLDVLATLYGDVLIPTAVHVELIEKRPTAPGVEALRQAAWLRVVDAGLLRFTRTPDTERVRCLASGPTGRERRRIF